MHCVDFCGVCSVCSVMLCIFGVIAAEALREHSASSAGTSVASTTEFLCLTGMPWYTSSLYIIWELCWYTLKIFEACHKHTFGRRRRTIWWRQQPVAPQVRSTARERRPNPLLGNSPPVRALQETLLSAALLTIRTTSLMMKCSEGATGMKYTKPPCMLKITKVAVAP